MNECLLLNNKSQNLMERNRNGNTNNIDEREDYMESLKHYNQRIYTILPIIKMISIIFIMLCHSTTKFIYSEKKSDG